MKLTKGDVAHLTALMMGPAEFTDDEWIAMVTPLKEAGVLKSRVFCPVLIGRGMRNNRGDQLYFVTDEAKRLVANWEE